MSRFCLTTRVLLAIFVFLYMYTCLHTDGIDTWCNMNKAFCIRIFSNLTNSLVRLNKCLLYIFFLLCFSFHMQYKPNSFFMPRTTNFLCHTWFLTYCVQMYGLSWFTVYKYFLDLWYQRLVFFLSEQKRGASEQRIQLRTYELMDIFILIIIY